MSMKQFHADPLGVKRLQISIRTLPPGFRSFTYIREAAILWVYGGKREDAGGAGDERRS